MATNERFGNTHVCVHTPLLLGSRMTTWLLVQSVSTVYSLGYLLMIHLLPFLFLGYVQRDWDDYACGKVIISQQGDSVNDYLLKCDLWISGRTLSVSCQNQRRMRPSLRSGTLISNLNPVSFLNHEVTPLCTK